MMTKTTLTLTAVALCAFGCGGNTPGPVDAGVDTSCGIDCDAQTEYGLQPQTCFEFTSTETNETPPALGVLVGPVTTLEGGVKVMPVSYRAGGLTKMEDSFTIKNGDLYLVRRSWLPGESVTYKDDSGNLVGTLWVRHSTGAGENYGDQTKADSIKASGRTSDATTYTVITSVPGSTELQTPLEKYTDGLKLVFSETPNHGADSRRVLVRQKGFTLISSPLSVSGGTAQPYKLQNIKTLPAGSNECG